MKQNLTTVVEHTTKNKLEKLGLEQGMPLSKFVRSILEAYISEQEHPNKLVEVVKQADVEHREYVRKTKWKEVVNPDGTVDLVEDTDE